MFSVACFFTVHEHLFMVCISLSFHAMSYNFLSGSGDALAYDSLKSVEKEAYYEKYASNQLMLHRFCGGLSTLCAGFALFIGHKAAYGAEEIWPALSEKNSSIVL